MYEGDAAPRIVCAAAVLVLGRVSVPLVSESARSARAICSGKGQARIWSAPDSPAAALAGRLAAAWYTSRGAFMP